MFKKLFNKPNNKGENDTSSARNKPNQGGYPSQLEEISERPFDINLNELWEYEFEDLVDFINQYEQFSNLLRNKYNDILNEFLMAREKLGLLEKERKRLVNENEQYKMHVENLKKCLDEKNPSPASPDFLTTKSSSQHKTEEGPFSPVEFDQHEDETFQMLLTRAEKLVSELNKAHEPICNNILALVGDQAFMQNRGNTIRTEEAYEDESAGGTARGRALDTDNNEGLDSARVGEGTGTDREARVPLEVVLKEAVAESLGQALKRIGKEFVNIFDGCSDVYSKTKQKEKEMIAWIKSETNNKARSEEAEKELKELRGKLAETKTALNEARNELDQQTKMLEKTKKVYEEAFVGIQEERKRTQEEIEYRQREIEELNEVIEELKEKNSKDENTIAEIEAERAELEKRLEKMEKEYNLLVKSKEKIDKDSNQEVQNYQKSIQCLEEEKRKLEKRITRYENEKNDMENSLIQEKLKHHQTIADLTKMKEKYEEIEKNLNEEVSARKADFKKSEEMKKRLMELEKKEKEQKKTIKTLAEQIEAQTIEIKQLEEEKAKHQQHHKESSEHESKKGETDHGGHYEASEKAAIITKQYEKINHLEEKLEEAVKELNALQKSHQALQKEKEELTLQTKVLKEKRETGLQEIKRLTLLLESTKGNEPGSTLLTSHSRKEYDLNKSANYLSPVPITSPHSVAGSRINLDSEDLVCLKKIKKSLDDIYKDIIFTITNERVHESRSDRKPTGKLGELVKGPLPSEHFMKIEKRMNDAIVMLQEHIDNFE